MVHKPKNKQKSHKSDKSKTSRSLEKSKDEPEGKMIGTNFIGLARSIFKNGKMKVSQENVKNLARVLQKGGQVAEMLGNRLEVVAEPLSDPELLISIAKYVFENNTEQNHNGIFVMNNFANMAFETRNEEKVRKFLEMLSHPTVVKFVKKSIGDSVKRILYVVGAEITGQPTPGSHATLDYLLSSEKEEDKELLAGLLESSEAVLLKK